MADLDVRADKPQAEGTSQRGYDCRVAATPHIDEDSVEDNGGDGLDKTVDTGVQGNVSNAQGAEEGGGVVVDG